MAGADEPQNTPQEETRPYEEYSNNTVDAPGQQLQMAGQYATAPSRKILQLEEISLRITKVIPSKFRRLHVG